MLTCLFSKGHINGQIKVSVVGGEGVHGSLSQPTAYKALLHQEYVILADFSYPLVLLLSKNAKLFRFQISFL